MSYKAKWYRIRRVLFPRPCMLCRQGACIHSIPVCKDCVEDLRAALKEPCRFCGLPAAECICSHNKDVRFLLWYDLPLARKLIGMLKYDAKRERVEFLADRLAALCNGRYDGVTYIPRRPKEKRLYGYDHAYLLAEAIAKRLDLPLITTLECHSHLEQKFLSASQREKSMRGRYHAIPQAVEAYPRLLLIDDVCTTGATLRACSAILREAGAKAVSAAVLAKVQTNYKP
ncbi:MAG: ComF family protein [Clostridia bacterium]|nr:ComF family protein [Oscillospiraceae bacterium]MBQ8324321.1 ComF family protein [Clostridia bacterium]MBQ9132824.1 ComF family protein [Clostridia bacterium]